VILSPDEGACLIIALEVTHIANKNTSCVDNFPPSESAAGDRQYPFLNGTQFSEWLEMTLLRGPGSCVVLEPASQPDVGTNFAFGAGVEKTPRSGSKGPVNVCYLAD
jgi:hypothetical protein